MARVSVKYRLVAPAGVPNNQLDILDFSIGNFNIMPILRNDEKIGVIPKTFENTHTFDIFPVNQFTPVRIITKSPLGTAWALEVTFIVLGLPNNTIAPIVIVANFNGIGIFNQSVKWRN
ncbi:hypothetical protein GCM10027035_23590 [Emticicia sediminis]